MNVVLTCPSLVPHGGIRAILEWANRLASRGHGVRVRTDDTRTPDWFRLDPRVGLAYDDGVLGYADTLVACSPHAVEYLEREDGPPRRFAFCQMAEHLFRPNDEAWAERCRRFYLTRWPMLLISRWNEVLIREMGRTGPTHYIGNGVNLDDFPVTDAPKDGKTVLVEGWWPTNDAKDRDRLGARVALRLRAHGCRILAYGLTQKRRDPYRHVPHEYHVQPSLGALNELYERATILVKATRYDARSCAPMEAMTKGTVTVRAIEQGDDDLIDGVNAVRVPYAEDALYGAVRRLLSDAPLRERMAANCRAYVQTWTWDYWMDRIEAVLCSN